MWMGSRQFKDLNNLALIVIALALTACGSGSPGDRSGTLIIPSEGSILYISDTGGDAIISYNNANTVGGLVAPDRNIAGATTQLNGPRGIAVDMSRNLIYVANFDDHAILVYDGARSATGDIVPSRTIKGPDTRLKGPSRLYLDLAADRLYVANTNASSVLVFDNVSLVKDNKLPDREITDTATPLSSPQGIFVDASRDILYVSTADRKIIIYSNASTSDNDSLPKGVIDTQLKDPRGLYVNVLDDRLYVANAGSNSIFVYNQASEANNSSTPDRAIEASCGRYDP